MLVFSCFNLFQDVRWPSKDEFTGAVSKLRSEVPAGRSIPSEP